MYCIVRNISLLLIAFHWVSCVEQVGLRVNTNESVVNKQTNELSWVWEKNVVLSNANERQFIPLSYTVYSIRSSQLDSFFKSHVDIISLPIGQGEKLVQFKLVQNEVMPESLSEKYADIRSFKATGIDNADNNARVDYYQYLNAEMVIGQENYVLQYWKEMNTAYYIVFNRKDATIPKKIKENSK